MMARAQPHNQPASKQVGRIAGRLRALAVALVATTSAVPAISEPAGAEAGSGFRIGCTQTITSNLNRNDALASIKVLGQTILERHRLALQIEPSIFETTAEVQVELEKRRLDLIVMTSAEYLKLAAVGADLEPVFMPGYANPRAKEYLFVLSPGATNNLASLRGKRLLLLQGKGANLARPWLDLELRAKGLEPTDDFFGSVQEVSKPSAALLPVFFGKADACVLNRESYELNVELNPQLGARLRVLTNSPSYLESVLCLRRSFATHRAEVLAALGEMHQNPEGQQILTLFTISSIIPFRNEELTSVRQLLNAWHPLETAKP